MASVASGPMPGSTPISVPISAPKKQNSRFCGVSATLNPCAMLPSRSIASEQRRRPDWHRQLEAVDEQEDGAGGEPERQREGLKETEVAPARGAEEDVQDGREREACGLDQHREAEGGDEHEDERPQVPGRQGRAGLEQTPDGDEAAEQDEAPAEHHRHIA